MPLVTLNNEGERVYNADGSYTTPTDDEAKAAFEAATGLKPTWTKDRVDYLCSALAIPKYKGEEPDWKKIVERVLTMPRGRTQSEKKRGAGVRN